MSSNTSRNFSNYCRVALPDGKALEFLTTFQEVELETGDIKLRFDERPDTVYGISSAKTL